jgi:hypothetical protein
MTRIKRKNIDVGEWWLDDSGSAQYADGDIGDVNHEGMAFQSALGVDEEALGDLEINPAFGFNWTEIAERFIEDNDIELTLEQINALSEKEWKEFVNNNSDISDAYINADRDIALAFSWLEDNGANMDFVNWYVEQKGMPDAREYALEKWGWIRVQGAHFQTHVFGKEALDIIRRSDIWTEAMAQTDDEEDVENSTDEVTIEELSTGKSFTVELKDLLNDAIPIEGIKAIARGEEWARPEEKKIPVFPKATGDAAGEENWLYRRKGD